MWELGKAVNELKDTYKCIDLRGVIFYSIDNREWFCGFLTICFTNMDENEVKIQHRVIRDNSDIPDGIDLKVLLECKPINEIQSHRQEFHSIN